MNVPGTPERGTRVTCEDCDGHQKTVVIENDHLVITDGNRYIAAVQAHPKSGTYFVTIKTDSNPSMPNSGLPTKPPDSLFAYPWRVGRKVGRTIYEQLGSEASDNDTLIGLMDTAELAATVVDGRARVEQLARALQQVLICVQQIDWTNINQPESPVHSPQAMTQEIADVAQAALETA